MIMVGFGNSQQAQDSLAYDLSQRNLGGVLLFAYNLRFPSQIKSQSTRLQQQAETPLFLATDQEGGIVARLDENNGFSRTYTAHKLGTEFNSEDSTRSQAQRMANWMKSSGLNMNLAPVVDVNINPESPAIAGLDRSFSSDEEQVYAHASWFIDEFQKMNIATTLKHFPGHGSAVDDSHNGFTDITDTWEERELTPFKLLIDDGYQDAIMTGHLFNHNWDQDYPSSLSHAAVSGMLRDSLGFEGVVITDELFMDAIQENYGFDESIIQVINSDTDILLFSTNLYKEQSLVGYVTSLVKQKVKEGIIAEATIDNSYRRIMNLKEQRITTQTDEPIVFKDELPEAIDISNYPNPFNPSTTIVIQLKEPVVAQIQIFNSIGQNVETITRSNLSSGTHQFNFHAEGLSSGMYFVVVHTKKTRVSHKMMVIK
jgi:beta-N-acetylhexosaminidase